MFQTQKIYRDTYFNPRNNNILFKTLYDVYVTKLPREVRSRVLAHGMLLDSREMTDLADDLWCGLNKAPLRCQGSPHGSSGP